MNLIGFFDRVVAYREWGLQTTQWEKLVRRAGTFGKLMEEYGEYLGALLKEHERYKVDEEFGDTLFSLLYLIIDELGEDAARTIVDRVGSSSRLMPASLEWRRARCIKSTTEAFAVLMMHIDEEFAPPQISASADIALRYLLFFGVSEVVQFSRAYKTVSAKNDKKITGETPTRRGASGNMIRV